MTFFFTAIFMILVLWRPQEWLVPWLYGFPLLDFVVFFALLAFAVEVKEERVKVPHRMPQLYLLGGLWLATIMSHVVHGYFAGMLNTIPETFKICFFTGLLLCTLDSPDRLRATSTIFVMLSCMMAIHAIMQQRLGYGFMGLEPIIDFRPGSEEPVCRSFFFGIFGDPNDLAQMLATSIPLAFVITKRRSFFSVIMSCAIAYLLILGMLATYSRSGFVALAGVGAVVAILRFPVRWMPVLMTVALLGALVLCSFSMKQLDISAHDRVVFWGLANQVFISTHLNFFFGIGFGMFWTVASSRAAHNAFVSCYTELGVFGYWFWFGMIFLGIAGAWRARIALANPKTTEQEWTRRFSGLGIAAMVGFLASAYFLSRTFIYTLFFLMAMLGSLPTVADGIQDEDASPVERENVLVPVSIAVTISIFYIYVSIILLNKVFYA